MDPEEFKKKLEEFAELKQLKTPRSPDIRENNEPEVICRGGKELTVKLDNNPTIGWGITKLKPHVAVCEDCCQVVENRVVDIKQYQFPKRYWRKNCKACSKTQNPYTGKFDIPSAQTFYIYNCYLNDLPEPQPHQDEEKTPKLKPVYKKPTK